LHTSDTGVVAQNVDGAESIDRGPSKCLDGDSISDIGPHCKDLAERRQIFLSTVEITKIVVCDDYFHSFLQESTSQAEPDAICASGHYRYTALKISHQF
jgi:hypothetical protein